MKLGKKAPRIDKRTLKLSSYTAGMPLVAPKRIDWSLGVNDWREMLNDKIGCCTVSAMGHLIQAWTCNNGAEVVVPDGVIQQTYSDITGYVPGDASTDNGAVELDVLNYWRRTGIAGHKIDGYVSVNPLNREHVKLSVDLFGGGYIGVSLPVSAQSQEVWSVPDSGPVDDGQPGSWGGHALPILNYGPAGLVVVTWGKLMTMSWEFFETYCDEMYCILAPDWVSRTKASPGLVDYQSLQADLNAVAS